MSNSVMSLGLILALSGSIAMLGGCSSANKTTGQSQVREVPVPSSGPAANQAAWEQGRVPKGIRNMPSASSKPPVAGEKTYTSTTAPTGEVRSLPQRQASSTSGKPTRPSSSGYQ